MTADLLSFPNADEDVAIEPDDVAIEPELPGVSDEPAIELEPAPAAAALAALPLVEVLPADFKLPALVRFVPNTALRKAADEAGTYALGLKVDGPEGLQRADVALQTVRASLKAIEGHFDEPCEIANALHKRLTGIRGEWLARGKQAIDTVGRRIYDEQRRLEAIAAEERRRAQAEADRQAREAARKEAEAAAKAQAPAPVVEELKRQAETATAPPVAVPATAPPPLRGSTAVERWKARPKGTPGSDDPNPEMSALTPAQRACVLEAMRAVLDGKAPLILFNLNWSEINRRAAAEKGAFAIPGFESFDAGGVRAKSTRTR